MVDILNRFPICSEISEELKQKIEIFYVFDDINGYNIVFITNTDDVYALGSNQFGCCGFGHNRRVVSPKIIPELCQKTIKQFFNGWGFVLALNSEHQIYGWGWNYCGQLGRGYINSDNKFQKPEIISGLKDVIQVSCGSYHSLALTTKGHLYGWGYNGFGEIGCGKGKEDVSKPKELMIFNGINIKSIYCSDHRSYAVTNDGLVYSWGSNKWCLLGHDLDENENVFEPKLLNISKVISVCNSSFQTYFLTNEGIIYFCGTIDLKTKIYQKLSKRINCNKRFISLQSISRYYKRCITGTAISDGFVYYLSFINFEKSKYKSHFDYYSDYYEMTDKTIDMKTIRNPENVLNFNRLKIYDILRNFVITSEKNAKYIKRFHIFDDKKGLNVLFITNNDEVYSFGENFEGCCGLGHENCVFEPQLIPELSQKIIIQFFNGMNFVLALNSDHQIYSWGSNSLGQLGREYVSNSFEYLRPDLAFDLKNEEIIQISCGSYHCLVLTSNGTVYGWGYNYFGQIGCEDDTEICVSKPVILKSIEINNKIESIYCSDFQSFAVTNKGLVYSWGWNQWCKLGHDLDEEEMVFEPKLLNISNVITVCNSKTNTYFLTNEGNIYFCGLMSGEDNNHTFEKFPKLLKTETKFNSLLSMPKYQTLSSVATAYTSEYVYRIQFNRSEKTNYKTIYDFYFNECEMTFQTISSYNDLDSGLEMIDKYLLSQKSEQSIYEMYFNEFCEIGKGSFGQVCKAHHKFNSNFYAIKKIFIQDPDIFTKKIKEVKTLYRVNGHYVVQSYDSWFEDNHLFIQTEMCSYSLKDLIERKDSLFESKDNVAMNTIEYFISSQIFKDIIECVQYLHELDPPIIHRDLKPANILVNEDSENGKFFKLCDFGLATIGGLETETKTKFVGTEKYMAPEVNAGTAGKSRYSIKADIYSLGKISIDLFDCYINALEENSAKNIITKQEWKVLNELIEKTLNHNHKLRPTCADMLSISDEWTLKSKELKRLENFDIENISDTFFLNYLISKLSEPDTSSDSCLVI